MRWWIGLAADLYPGSWRGRYGEEFQALLEDLNPGWREFTDVLRGALKMQMTNATTYLKLVGGLAVAGAIVATAVSFSFPRIYESTAVMRIAEPQNPQGGASTVSEGAVQEHVGYQLLQIEQKILSRTNLERIITAPDLDLYKEDRSRLPMEDIVQNMRHHDIRILMVGNSPGAPGAKGAFTVSFSYPGQQKAQAVVRALTTQFIDQNLKANRSDESRWQTIWPQSVPPLAPALEVLDPASLPEKPINASREAFAAVGLVLGLALGLLAAVALRRPRWTLKMAGFAVGCCGLTVAASFLLPETYRSTAVMQFTRAYVPEDLAASVSVTLPAKKLQQLEEVVLSDTILEVIITSPALDLYKKQREQKPMHEIAETMRRHLSIQMVNPSHSAFLISFSYLDPYKAQAVVREIVVRFIEENVSVEQERARASGNAKSIEIAEHRVGENLEVLDPPSDPQEPFSPNRLAIALASISTPNNSVNTNGVFGDEVTTHANWMISFLPPNQGIGVG
jgi:uncharacterized protein involved in exopolysaccharide biosynthesis